MAADAPAVPRWQKNPDNPFEEAVTIRNVLRLFVKHKDSLKIGTPQLFLINNTLSTVEGIVERGSITPDERARLLQQRESFCLQCCDHPTVKGLGRIIRGRQYCAGLPFRGRAYQECRWHPAGAGRSHHRVGRGLARLWT